MNVRERFRELVARQPAQFVAPELLPVRLARAAVDIAPAVHGAGISVLAPGGVRIPIGASDPHAATAERLQFTFGEGPCVQVARTGRPLFADAARFAASWPLLYQELRTRTPYRAVLSLPLRRGSWPFGSVNLNLADDPAEGIPPETWSTARTVADEIGTTLTTIPPGRDGDASTPPARDETDDPAWLNSPPAQRRQQVWIAIGMLSVQLGLNPADALAELRALTFTAGLDLDQYAADLVNRRTPLPDRDQ
jgi:hypothetical protein